MAELNESQVDRLTDRLKNGDILALARALTLVENGGGDAQEILSRIEKNCGQARIIGFTGPPGAGKSTLVDALIHEWRSAGHPVAVLAVDPVSPVSGGAVLGDRTRMGAHTLDDGVFIRSVSARGHLGGLSATAHDMADVIDAAGWPLIVIETVGAGQSETEITQVADLSVVVSAPGLGDDLQAIKAGILEIGDVLVVNKADREDADKTAKHLESMLALRSAESRDVPVLKVSASEGSGISELASVLHERLQSSSGDRLAKRRARKFAIAAQLLASRISAGIPEEELLSLGQREIDEAIKQSLAALSAEVEE